MTGPAGGATCDIPAIYVDYASTVEYRDLFKDPKNLRKTPFAGILIHKLIQSSHRYFGSRDADAAHYAIRNLTGYAAREHPALSQKSRYAHTLDSAAQFLFAASVAHAILQAFDGYTAADQAIVGSWLKRKTLGRPLKYKDRSKWYGSDGVKAPSQKLMSTASW